MISEIDLKDFDIGTQPVKLYDCPRHSIVSPVFNPELKIQFHHLDGMYSFCTMFGTDDVLHMGACTDVFVWSKK
jgi:hypothetical protein